MLKSLDAVDEEAAVPIWREREIQLAHELRQQSLAQLRQMSSLEIVAMVRKEGRDADGQGDNIERRGCKRRITT